MEDMFDPSITEQISRATKQIAINTSKVDSNLRAAGDAATRLNTRMQALIGHTTGAADATKNITAHLNSAAKGAKSVTENVTKTNVALSHTSEELQKSNKMITFMQNALEGMVAYILTDVVLALGKLHSAGFAPTQVAANELRVELTQISMLLQGMPVSANTIASSLVGLTKSLGGAGMFTDKMTKDVTWLNSAYGVSLETGTKITSMLYRWSDGSERTAKNTLDFAKGLGDATGVPVGLLLEDMAKNSALVARYGAQGAENFLRQAVELRRMGTTFEDMSKFSDKLVDDFEGTLKATAKIQTFLPGFNMAGIQFAAQFGTEADVAKEMKSALSGAGMRDMSQLPRSLRNALAGSLGMSQETLQNLMHTVKPVTADKQALPKDIEAGTEKVAKILLWGFGLTTGLLATYLGGNIIKSLIEGKGAQGGFINRLLNRPNRLFGGGTGGAGGTMASVARSTEGAAEANVALRGLPLIDTRQTMMERATSNVRRSTAAFSATKTAAMEKIGELSSVQHISEMPGQAWNGVKNLSGKALGKARGALGGAKTFMKSGGGLALAGMIGGPLLDMVGDKLKSGGHERLGGLAAAGGMAVSGASMGMMFGPVGVAIGAALGGIAGLLMNGKEIFGGFFSWLKGFGTNMMKLFKPVIDPVVKLLGYFGKAIMFIFSPFVKFGEWLFGWVKRLGIVDGKQQDLADTSNSAAQANEALAKSASMVQDKFSEVGGQNFGFAKTLFENGGGTVGVPSGATVVPTPVETPASEAGSKAVTDAVTKAVATTTPVSSTTDMTALLQAVQQLATVYRSTKWDVNLDGKKVGAGIIAANRA